MSGLELQHQRTLAAKVEPERTHPHAHEYHVESMLGPRIETGFVEQYLERRRIRTLRQPESDLVVGHEMVSMQPFSRKGTIESRTASAASSFPQRNAWNDERAERADRPRGDPPVLRFPLLPSIH